MGANPSSLPPKGTPMRNQFKRLGVLAAAVAISAGLAFGVAASAAAAPTAPAASSTSIPYKPCFGTVPATQQAQIPGHIAYECVGLGKTAAEGVGVYWADNLYSIQFYWHPGHGGQVIQESFLKSCAEVNLERHLPPGGPCTNYSDLPLPDTTPGQDKVANGRLIWLADGCVLAAPTDLGAPPTQCAVVIQGGGADVSPGRPLTAAEQADVNGFWSIMNRYTLDHPYNYW